MTHPVVISVVSPVYRAEDCVEELVNRLSRVLEGLVGQFEIILVDDGSPDGSWAKIRKLAHTNPHCKGILLSRNFGQHYAITAGLEVAVGDWVVVMDCDLQDQPEEIPKLYHAAIDGNYDIVFARRALRQDGWWKKLSSRCFYAIYNYLTEARFDRTIANFSIVKRPVIQEFLRLGEQNRLFPLFLNWLGFRTGSISVAHAQRFAGRTSYSFKKLVKLSADNIISQSNRPLVLSVWIGAIFAFWAFCLTLYYVAKYFTHGIAVTGWTSMMVSIWFVGGLIMMQLGILGMYLGRVFNEVKARPLYVVKERIGNHDGVAPDTNT